MNLIFINAEGISRTIDATPGESVMEAARRNDVEGIVADCGGSCSCATCHVYVLGDHENSFSPPEDFETDMLEGVTGERRPCSRLSCQLVLADTHDGLAFEIPAAQ